MEAQYHNKFQYVYEKTKICNLIYDSVQLIRNQFYAHLKSSE